VEHWVRALRTECLNWLLNWNRHRLEQVLAANVGHYGTGRPHRGIDCDMPMPPSVATATVPRLTGSIERVDVLGGLIPVYRRAA
jgi:hypothetical protein